ncbi:MAG: site-specific DNA-methyltransferase [Paludibacter sp.]|nr:site-specific DNA-methyltransferase [Paludibacter sp.]
MIQLRKGDCLELMKDIADGSVDCVVTDPPYKVTSSGNVPTGFINGHWRLKNGQANPQAKSGKIFKENEIKFSEWMPEIYRVLKERTHFYCMTNDLHLKTVIDEGIKAGFKQQNILVWAKGMHTPTQYYFKNIEFIVMFRKGNAKYINNIGTMALLNVKGLRNKIHPSEKPTELMKILIENSSKENEIVLDPFMGLGSTGVACINTNRNFIGMELDDKYFEIAKERIEKAIAEEEMVLFKDI